MSSIRPLPLARPGAAPSPGDRVIEAAVAAYARNLGRLTADFSAAAAFLLSDPVFERLGCNGRAFVEAARQAYAGRGPVSPVLARRRALRLLAESDAVLATLRAAARSHQAALEEQRRAVQALGEESDRISAEVSRHLAGLLEAAAADLAAAGVTDPEACAARLGEVASAVFATARQGWDPIFARLPNLVPPPPPLMFSGRQIYIETVKLYNQHRLGPAEAAAPEGRGLRGLLGGGRRAERQAAGAARGAIPDIVVGVGQAISAAVGSWHRSAYERVQRRGLETGLPAGQAELAAELDLIQRCLFQLVSLKRELHRGVSVRRYFLALLCEVSSCSRSA